MATARADQGLDLGFRQAGLKGVWHVEIDEKARSVLARHFPESERI
jgi:site-specific DNA-cytosine methylase